MSNNKQKLRQIELVSPRPLPPLRGVALGAEAVGTQAGG
jgi:hypothetical protein